MLMFLSILLMKKHKRNVILFLGKRKNKLLRRNFDAFQKTYCLGNALRDDADYIQRLRRK